MARFNRFDQLIADWEPRLQKAFLEAVYTMRDATDIARIAERLERGDIEGAMRAVGLDPAQWRPFERKVIEGFEASGNFIGERFPRLRDGFGNRVVFQFNIRNPRAEQWLREVSSRRIVGLADDLRTAVRNVLSNGLAEGLNPRTVALSLVGRVEGGKRIGGYIGLNDQQTRWAINYEKELRENPAASLQRNLRDKRFDGTVARAVRSGEPIPADTFTKMVNAYRNRALRLRAETIARTETMFALHAAQEIAIDQAVTGGLIESSQVTMVWRATKDNRTRDVHRELDGQRKPWSGEFQTPLGPIAYPGDPMADPANTINCRCWLEPDIDFLAGIR